MSVRVTLNCQLKANQYDNLLPFLHNNLKNVRGFEGNLNVSVLYDDMNNEMLLDEQWLSVKAHQAYLAHIDSNGVLAQLAAFLDSPPTIKYFQTIEI